MSTVDASREDRLGHGMPHESTVAGVQGDVDAAQAFNAAGHANTTGLSGPAVRRRTIPQDASEAAAGAASPEAASTLDLVEAFMTGHRPFLRSELTLAELALQFRLPPRRLSQLVNQGRGRNFADWVNHYRIKEAKRLLADPASGIRSVLDAMYAAGFSSKSSFNALFKASTGVTPDRIHACAAFGNCRGGISRSENAESDDRNLEVAHAGGRLGPHEERRCEGLSLY
jgi:AraC-like DNA-binding protein